jgi:hypothetical protein
MKNVKNRSIFGRKGIVDIQFNWIFILIVGFVIFLFIISIVYSQKRNADLQSGISITNQITTLLKSKQQTADVYSEISFPRSSINFRCDLDEKYFSYKISESERIPLSTEIVFAPQEISSNKMQVWSKAFNTGFPVNVFTYITTEDSIIIIYNNTNCPNAKVLYDSLPDDINKKLTNNTLAYSSYKNMKIVCFARCGCPSSNLRLDYINITIGNMSGVVTDLYGFGNITFYKKGIRDKTYPYIMEAGLYGAIFSGTADYYACQMSRAMEQFEIKRSLVEKRLNLMQKDMVSGSCGLSLLATLNTNVIPMSNPSFNYTDITRMYMFSINIDKRNVDLTLSSCPKIY